MFFPRLRRHAKWMFVLLALVFGVGFVVFGVGASGTGLGDLLQGGGGSGSSDTPSVSDARKKISKNPNDAAAYRELATALQTENRTDEAVEPLERYTELRPKDTDALRELASLYVGQVRKLQDGAAAAQAEAADLTVGSSFGAQLELGQGQTLGQDPIRQALDARATELVTAATTKIQDALDRAKATYQRLVTVVPKDADAQLNLGLTAEQAGDNTTAIAAYNAFLKLAPDDSQAPFVKQEIARLRSSATSATG